MTDYARHFGLQVNFTEQYPVSKLVLIGAVLGSGKYYSMCLLASLLFLFHMECSSEIIWLLVSNAAFKLSS